VGFRLYWRVALHISAKQWLPHRVSEQVQGSKIKRDKRRCRKPLSTTKIPYIKGESEKIRRILKWVQHQNCVQNSRHHRQDLTTVKDPTPPEERTVVIYKINCICGDFYVGEMGKKKLDNQDKRAQGSMQTCCIQQISGCQARMTGKIRDWVEWCRNPRHSQGPTREESPYTSEWLPSLAWWTETKGENSHHSG